MASTPNHIVITNPDGSTTTIDVTYSPPVIVPPPPHPPMFPEGANTVTIAGLSYPLAAIDPPTSDPKKPGGRDTDQVIIITKSSTPPRNIYGFEIGILGGKVVARGVNLAWFAYDYIVSGHGKGAAFVSGASIGATVLVEKSVVPPVIVPPPAVGHPIMAEYWMESVGHIGQIGPKCDRAIVAFYQNTDLVSWGGDSWDGLTAWRNKPGRDVLISLGGQGGTVVLDQVDEGIERINRTRFPIDGIDFDNEAFGLSTQQVIDICDATSGRLGRAPKDFIVQFVPPGGDPVARAIAAAQAVKAKGYRVYLGQQLYETSISDSDVMRQTGIAVDALGAPQVLVGMMIGDSHNSWTVANAVTRMQMVKNKWNDIGGAYIWESSRTGTLEVVQGVGTVLGL